MEKKRQNPPSGLNAMREKKLRNTEDDSEDSGSEFDPDSEEFDQDDDDFVVDDDDEEALLPDSPKPRRRDAGNSKKSECMYGANCYRKNPAHFQEYAHPWLHKKVDKTDRRTPSTASLTPAAGAEEAEDDNVIASPGSPTSLQASIQVAEEDAQPNSTSPHTRLEDTCDESITTDVEIDTLKEQEPKNNEFGARLGIPIMGVESGGFSPEDALDVALEATLEWFGEMGSIPLTIGDESESVIRMIQKKFDTLIASGVKVMCGDLLSAGDCRYIATETTWRVKPSSALSARIFEAAGEGFDTTAKQICGGTVKVGQVYPIPYPIPSLSKEDRTLLITVAPNILSSRADQVTDLVEAKEQLKAAYKAVFKMFRNLTRPGSDPIPKTSLRHGNSKTTGQQPNAFTAMMKAASTSKPNLTTRAADNHGDRKGRWDDALLPYIREPGKYGKDEVEEFDNDFVVIRDKYPKAKHHFLVMPRKEIDGLKSLNGNSIGMVEALIQKGKAIVQRVQSDDPKSELRTGFHAVPSMRQLHLHVISQDFNSPALKNKKHYNSFTTEFFREAEEVLRDLRKKGEVKLDESRYEGLLKSDLCCHICKEKIVNMPRLKSHLLTHVSE